jgi:hypothetical protein
VRREHGPAERVNLDLPTKLEARALEPEIEAADAGEQAANGHSLPQSR